MWRFLPGVPKVSASKKIPLLITARQQRSMILVNTIEKTALHRTQKIFIEVAILSTCRRKMKEKLDTDGEGMISDHESELECPKNMC